MRRHSFVIVGCWVVMFTSGGMGGGGDDGVQRMQPASTKVTEDRQLQVNATHPAGSQCQDLSSRLYQSARSG